MGAARVISLPGRSYYFDPLWSPDSKKIAFIDNHLSLWYVDLDQPQPRKIDSDTYFSFAHGMNPSWSPDSAWVAYTKLLANHMRAVFAYSLDSGTTTQVTDGMSDARFAAFDKGGKYLYFTASTNSGPTEVALDMSSLGYNIKRSVYLLVLRRSDPSPLRPESDEEHVSTSSAGNASNQGKPPAKEAGKEGEKGTHIDFDGIAQRILALPVPAANYVGLAAGKEGELFLEQADPEADSEDEGPVSLLKFTLSDRKLTPLASGINDIRLSFNGEKYLFRKDKDWGIASTAAPLKPGEGLLDTAAMQVAANPRKEWKQMYQEVWRIERDYFYAKNYDGLNIAAAEKQYSAFLPGIVSREDLNYLFREMLGKLSVGHMFAQGGDVPKVAPVSVGLLGADYSVENGRYRFTKIYSGENWNPHLRAPLTEPGIDVKTGDYLLAVNGRELHGSDNIYQFFLNTAGKQLLLKVGPHPDGSQSREITVVPVEDEMSLRFRDWIQGNIRKVDQLSGGKIAYVYLPDTAMGGYTYFNRYFFAQVNKQAVIIDDRFNSGGQAADYIISILQRKLWNYWYTPSGAVATEPGLAIFGPKAMLINQYAGSGGDLIPWIFHHVGLGPLIGERTWGGEGGITGYPDLIDGGSVTAPNLAFFTTEGHWGIENEGVPPDIEVEMEPQAWRQNHDPQLEKAVQVLLEDLRQHPLPQPKVPAFPSY